MILLYVYHWLFIFSIFFTIIKTTGGGKTKKQNTNKQNKTNTIKNNQKPIINKEHKHYEL